MLGLFLMMTILAAMPSASVLLVVTRSARRGFCSGAAAAAGIVAGDLVFLVVAIWGTKALADSMGALFLLVKIAASVYLMSLGVRMLLGRQQRAAVHEVDIKSTVTSFFGGLLITLGDVKAILFYASLLPVFVEPGELGLDDAVWIGVITITAVGGVKLLYAALARRILSKLRSKRVTRGGELAAGSCLIGAGAYMMSKA